MKYRTFLATASLAFVASCQGCFGCKTSPVDNPANGLPGTCQTQQPAIAPPKLDILFVIDNSNSMAEEQAGVATELTAFIEELKKGGGVPSDFNIGVVTTGVYLHGKIGDAAPFFTDYPYQSGHLRPVPVALDGGLTDFDNVMGERLLVGTDPDLITKFDKLVRQGISGSGQETPFEAVRLALTTPGLIDTPLAEGGNGGFLRDGARLLVVVLSDEDDCSEEVRPPLVIITDDQTTNQCSVQANSLTTVSEYHRIFTEELKNSDGTRKEVIWTAIAPVGIDTKAAQEIIDNGHVRNIDCPTSNQGGLRHRQMAEMFDSTLVNLDSICRSSYRDTLINIAQLASVVQSLTIDNIPDPGLLAFVITRADNSKETCTFANNGLVNFSRSSDGATVRIQFGNQCRRRADDISVTLKLICAL